MATWTALEGVGRSWRELEGVGRSWSLPGGLEVEHLDERLDGARLADAQLHALVLMRAPEGIGMSPSGSEGIRGDPRGSEGIRGDQKGIRGDQRGSEGIRGDQTGLRRG